MIAIKSTFAAFLLGVFLLPAARAEMMGPLGGSGLSGEYAGFFDSPFAHLPLTGGGPGSYFHLKDFEDGSLDAPGVSVSGLDVRITTGDDSVDFDDGIVDGSGRGGRSVWGWGIPGITIMFDADALGHLPNHVGIVWTDGVNPVTFWAYDARGTLIGLASGSHADASFDGTTADDRFYGVRYGPGIRYVQISNGGGPGTFAGIEVDHLQYAYAVPEPETISLLLAGLGLLGLRIRSRRR